MADNWIVVQVGPVLQVPRQARFRNKQGWWYVYRRSRAVDPLHTERETDPWSATKFHDKFMALGAMHQHAKELCMPWRLVRQLSGQEGEPVAYFPTKAIGELWRPFKSDVMMPALWMEDENVT